MAAYDGWSTLAARVPFKGAVFRQWRRTLLQLRQDALGQGLATGILVKREETLLTPLTGVKYLWEAMSGRREIFRRYGLRVRDRIPGYHQGSNE